MTQKEMITLRNNIMHTMECERSDCMNYSLILQQGCSKGHDVTDFNQCKKFVKRPEQKLF
jgi:hypothetical protein